MSQSSTNGGGTKLLGSAMVAGAMCIKAFDIEKSILGICSPFYDFQCIQIDRFASIDDMLA